MATLLFPSNDPSDISGYKKLYINTRSPNASATPSTAVTNTASGTATIAMTLTAGGSAAAWISAPLKAAVTVSQPFVSNLWGLESAAGANALIAYTLAKYTTSIQAAFTTTSTGAELGTSAAARVVWALTTGSGGVLNKESVTSTSFAIGDRIALLPIIGPVGVMGAGETVTFDYNGLAGVDGDSYVELNSTLEAGAAQIGSGENVGITGKGVSYFYDLENTVQNGINEGLYASNATAQMIIDEANDQANLS